MSVLLETITEEEFKKSVQLFNDTNTDRRFLKIKAGKSEYAIGWRSDLLKPVILEILSNVYIVGIDQDVAVVDFEKNIILLKIDLSFSLYDIQFVNGRLFVLTELEVLEMSITSWQVVQTYLLPDYFQEILIVDGSLKAKCVDGSIVDLAS
ncbi:hypothetical protein A4H97_34055 [Niastella yeongjuensis]|uniref:Uncharacterized protein n=1 Tax=Niastella yeongjuensis TaxID=354355 RepID=A0A1V9EBN1_9BACT|nr:hypothetical protein [Niastella yeongjuensis]OQP43335.1 hypothetical protein A4H97_34055 [Niastella yeongjuensis]SEP47771.1 hypothetical protein SAMN05660816_06632 [Niastella yeongjuensis]